MMVQISPRRGKPSLQAIACVGALAEAIGSDMEEHVRNVIDSMFAVGLNPTLVTALKQIAARYLWYLLFTVQDGPGRVSCLSYVFICMLTAVIIFTKLVRL